MLQVAKMTPEDFDFAVRLSDTMDWNLTEEDFVFITNLEPDGCFTLRHDTERVGIATTISFETVGWIGNVIVQERRRKQGGGSLLVRQSIEYLLKKRQVETIGVYAYFNKIPFYTRLGFEYDSEFVVVKGKGRTSPVSTHLMKARGEDIRGIIEQDRLCFGAPRSKLLTPLLGNPDNVCFVAEAEGRMQGFVVTKVYENMAEIGPLVCRQGRRDIAMDLVRATLNRLEGFDLVVCLPSKEQAMLATLTELGFHEEFRVARMFYGNKITNPCVYVAESLERG